MRKLNKVSVLKALYFLGYPVLIYLLIPYVLSYIFGDGLEYRTQMTFVKMGFVCLLNGPLFLLFYYCIPKSKELLIAHVVVLVLILYVYPVISFPVQYLLVSHFELLSAMFGVEIFMILYKLRANSRLTS